MIAFRVVDLPAPLRPSSATTSPAPASRLTSKSTWARPYPALRPRISSVAKVHLTHPCIGTHLLRSPRGDDFAEVHDDHAAGKAEHHARVVLGKEHRDAVAPRQSRRQAHQGAAFFRRHPGGRL